MQVPEPDHTLSLIFTIAVVLSILVQAAVFVGLYFAVTTALKKVTAILEEVKGKAMPLVGSAQGIAQNVQSIVQDVTPKVKTVASHIVEISGTVRDQAKHVNSTVDDVVDKTKAQAAKVDDMVSAVLGSISHAGSTVQAGVAKPARRVSHIFQGFQATIESLFGKKPASNGRDDSPYPAGRTAERTTRYTTGVEEDFAATGTAASQTIHPPPTTSSPR